MLNDGQVAERGTHDELVAHDGGIYHRMWNAQRKANNATDDDKDDKDESDRRNGE